MAENTRSGTAWLQFMPIAHAVSIGYVPPMQMARVVGRVVFIMQKDTLSRVTRQRIQPSGARGGPVGNVDHVDVHGERVLAASR